MANHGDQESVRKMQQEAIARLEYLQVAPIIVSDYRDRGILYCSERTAMIVNQRDLIIPRVIELEPDIQEVIRRFEEENQSLVYHVVKTNTTFGLLYTFLLIGADVDTWNLDRQELTEKEAFCYVYNATYEHDSEFGSCSFESKAGGLLRIG